jgi:molybdate transport system substrate-binding protein
VKAAALAAALVLAGCGSGGDDNERPVLRVGAAASLRAAMADYARSFEPADVRLSFASSDELTAQAAAGAPIDVVLVADPALLRRLGVPDARPIAANRLVLGVPAGTTAVRTYHDLARRGMRVAAGSKRSPIGRYTHRFLARLPSRERAPIVDNIRSEEPDVGGIVGKLRAGAVDAGFVYASDVVSSKGALEAVDLPEDLVPVVSYGAIVLGRTKHPVEAEAFVGGLSEGAGAEALVRAGFETVGSW